MDEASAPQTTSTQTPRSVAPCAGATGARTTTVERDAAPVIVGAALRCPKLAALTDRLKSSARRRIWTGPSRPSITCYSETRPGVAQDVLPLLQDIVGRPQEHFVCISLNGANEVIEKRIVTIGLLDRSQVHPREVFADVIADRAAAVIFAHNHPSGDLRPSDADLRIHSQLMESAHILGLRVVDHVIVAKKGHYSFQESGLIS
ncbi:MAG: hypothetical protein C3F08_10965 [Candidatus Methylomirabilota bacterium]|nr:MAG: hypothetical protein C3F08_10965 [candidate division NC10 bacterium]